MVVVNYGNSISRSHGALVSFSNGSVWFVEMKGKVQHKLMLFFLLSHVDPSTD